MGDQNVLPAFARQIVSDIPPILDAADVSYFRESREARFGRPQRYRGRPRSNLATAAPDAGAADRLGKRRISGGRSAWLRRLCTVRRVPRSRSNFGEASCGRR